MSYRSIVISSMFSLTVLLFTLDYDNNFSYGYDGTVPHDNYHFSSKGKVISDGPLHGSTSHIQINGNSGVIVSGTPNGVAVIRLDMRPYFACENIKYAICFEAVISDVKNAQFSIGDKVLFKFMVPEKQIIAITNGNHEQTVIDIDLAKIRMPHLKDGFDIQEEIALIDKSSWFKEKFDGLLDLTRTSSIRESLKASNLEFSELNDPYSVIDQRNEEWVHSDGVTPLMIALNENEMSKLFKNIILEDKEKNKDIVFEEIFLTNAYGANIAQSQITTDYKQWDDEWWMITRQSGAYLDMEYDKDVNANAISVSLRILDSNGEFLGIIKCVINIENLPEITSEVWGK